MIKLFLDTNILLNSLLPEREAYISCISILLQNNIPLVTNEYVLKEARKILEEIYYFNQEDINQFMEFLRERMEVVKTPSKEEFKVINSSDKSDRPIIFSARKHQCILITDDTPTKRDAETYVQTFGSAEAIDIFGIKLAKESDFKSLQH